MCEKTSRFHGSELIRPLGANSTDVAMTGQRQPARDVLKDRADRLRRQAGQLHQKADRLEQLAAVMAGINGPAEEALWELAINHGNSPRLF